MRSAQWVATASMSCYELPWHCSVMIRKLHYMQISHVSADDGTFFYPLGPRGLVTKGLLWKIPAYRFYECTGFLHWDFLMQSSLYWQLDKVVFTYLLYYHGDGNWQWGSAWLVGGWWSWPHICRWPHSYHNQGQDCLTYRIVSNCKPTPPV